MTLKQPPRRHKAHEARTGQTRGGLTLSRKLGQAIMIELPHGGLAEVRVAQIRGGRVRLQCFAAPEIKFRRDDLEREPQIVEAA
jgi:sRNA-binding carbon storage regulator CsrA